MEQREQDALSINQSRLADRLQAEMTFHDVKAHQLDQEVVYNEGAINEAFDKLMRIAGKLEGKRILDYGCGSGWTSIQFAKRGATVFGIDVSSESLSLLKKVAAEKGFQNSVFVVQGACEHLPFKGVFDLIIGVAILHHLDVNAIGSYRLKESLKDGGVCLFMEPLAHNPIINFYRLLTPNRRTKDEKPMSMDMINQLKGDFSSVKIHGYHFLSLFSFIFFFFRAYNLFRRSNRLLATVDEAVFKAFPGLQKYCWGAIIELRK